MVLRSQQSITGLFMAFILSYSPDAVYRYIEDWGICPGRIVGSAQINDHTAFVQAFPILFI